MIVDEITFLQSCEMKEEVCIMSGQVDIHQYTRSLQLTVEESLNSKSRYVRD